MNERYQEEFNIIKHKLSLIGFKVVEEEEYGAIFGDGSNWKIDFYGERYGDAYWTDIRNIKYTSIGSLSIYFILQTFGLDILYKNKPIEETMDLLIEYKDKIFDETFPYQDKYDELNKLPDWVKTVDD